MNKKYIFLVLIIYGLLNTTFRIIGYIKQNINILYLTEINLFLVILVVLINLIIYLLKDKKYPKNITIVLFNLAILIWAIISLYFGIMGYLSFLKLPSNNVQDVIERHNDYRSSSIISNLIPVLLYSIKNKY